MDYFNKLRQASVTLNSGLPPICICAMNRFLLIGVGYNDEAEILARIALNLTLLNHGPSLIIAA